VEGKAKEIHHQKDLSPQAGGSSRQYDISLEDSGKQFVIVITTYEPAMNKWEPDRKTRRKHS
jgi:hypothetical protein